MQHWHFHLRPDSIDIKELKRFLIGVLSMAFYTDTVSPRTKRSWPSAFLGAFGRAFDRTVAAQNRSVVVDRLQRLSDVELADLGIKREDIVRYVYRDIFYV